jgi:hypothetical protein
MLPQHQHQVGWEGRAQHHSTASNQTYFSFSPDSVNCWLIAARIDALLLALHTRTKQERTAETIKLVFRASFIVAQRQRNHLYPLPKVLMRMCDEPTAAPISTACHFQTGRPLTDTGQ